MLVVDVAGCCGGSVFWREGGRANGLLNTGALLVVGTVRGGPTLGIPLTRRAEPIRDALLLAVVEGAFVEAVFERANDAADVFFCSVDGSWPGRAMDGIEDFLRNCSVDEAVRRLD